MDLRNGHLVVAPPEPLQRVQVHNEPVLDSRQRNHLRNQWCQIVALRTVAMTEDECREPSKGGASFIARARQPP